MPSVIAGDNEWKKIGGACSSLKILINIDSYNYYLHSYKKCKWIPYVCLDHFFFRVFHQTRRPQYNGRHRRQTSSPIDWLTSHPGRNIILLSSLEIYFCLYSCWNVVACGCTSFSSDTKLIKIFLQTFNCISSIGRNEIALHWMLVVRQKKTFHSNIVTTNEMKSDHTYTLYTKLGYFGYGHNRRVVGYPYCIRWSIEPCTFT